MNHVLKTKSWHYWLAKKFGNMYRWQADDMTICEYIRYVLKGLWSLTMLTIVVTVLSTLYLYGGYDCGMYLYNHFVIDDSEYRIAEISLFFILINIVIILFFIGYGIHKLKEKTEMVIGNYYQNRSASHVNNDSFVYLAWKKFKDKTCFKIDFE